MSNSNKKRVKKQQNKAASSAKTNQNTQQTTRPRITGKTFLAEIAAYFVIAVFATGVQALGGTLLHLTSNYVQIVLWVAAAALGMYLWDKFKVNLSIFKQDPIETPKKKK